MKTIKPLAIIVLAALSLVACRSTSQSVLASRAIENGKKAHLAGNLDQAEEYYKQALIHDPTSKWAYYDLGLVAQTQGNIFAAEQEYRNALAFDPNFESALFNLALVRVSAGAPNEAIVLYKAVIAVNSKNAAAHHNLGLLLIEQGKVKQGQTQLKVAETLDARFRKGGAATPTPSPATS